MTASSHHGRDRPGPRHLIDQALHQCRRVLSPTAAHPPRQSQSLSLRRKLRCILHRPNPPNSDVSLELWNAAYDSLRDSCVSASLVTAYEAIIAQLLPHHLKPSRGGTTTPSFRHLPADQRLRLMSSIAEAGLDKECRPSTPSPSPSATDDYVRALLGSSKHLIESAWSQSPSAAIAWSGISTLTPLLLHTILESAQDIGCGIAYIIARIPWYAHLSELLVAANWKDAEHFRCLQLNRTNALIRLYRNILQFQMSCVCAAASTWSHVARSVVDWNHMGRLLGTIQDDDETIMNEIEEHMSRPARESLLRYTVPRDPESQVLTHVIADKGGGGGEQTIAIQECV